MHALVDEGIWRPVSKIVPWVAIQHLEDLFDNILCTKKLLHVITLLSHELLLSVLSISDSNELSIATSCSGNGLDLFLRFLRLLTTSTATRLLVIESAGFGWDFEASSLVIFEELGIGVVDRTIDVTLILALIDLVQIVWQISVIEI